MNSPGPSPIPEGRILLHVGMHKTGTTAIQEILRALRPALAEQGVAYPTDEPAHHVHARALLGLRFGWRGKPTDPAVWDELVRIVQASTASRIVLSSERFSAADVTKCRQIADDLSAERLHVLIGARNFAPTAVSFWQQSLKRGQVATLDEWLQQKFVRSEQNPTPRFWRLHDPSVVAQRWADVLGPDRVTVVVVDESDRALLPATFEQLLALSPGVLTGAAQPASNRSMTAPEAELARRTNDALRQYLKWPEYEAFVRNNLALMVERRPPLPDEPRIPIPDWVAEQSATEGARVAAALQSAGVNVVGDLAQLSSPLQSDRISHGPTDVPWQVPVDAAVELIRDTVVVGTQQVRALTKELKRERRVAARHPRLNELTTAQLAAELRTRLRVSVRRRLRGRASQ